MKSQEKIGKLYALYLAILPLVSIYKLPGTSLALATALTLVMMIYAVVSILTRKRKVNFAILLPFIMYLLYIMTKSTLLFSILCIAIMIHILAISTGVINKRYLCKFIEGISVVAAICVIIQQIVHILTKVHIPLYISSLLAEGLQEQYKIALTTGTPKIFYRPSAFFLEPAHFTQYCMIGLGSCLFSQVETKWKPLLISAGILATTSGMGIVAVAAMWIWWGLVRRKNLAKGSLLLRIVGIIVLVIISFVILDNISLTHNTISRIIADPEVENNAIIGRTFWWETYFGNMDFYQYLTGFGLENLPEGHYFTGFMKQLYCYGIIGTTLLFIFLIIIIVISDNLGKICCSLYTGLIFFSELTGYFWLIFYVGFFVVFYISKRVGDNKSLKRDLLRTKQLKRQGNKVFL